jgi:Rrf2 family protein
MYALRALFDIAFHNHGRPTKVDAIALREEVPPRFLEQIFQDLKSAKLVGSKRGPNGGYFLVKSPETITVGDVIRAIEGPIEAPDGRAGDASEGWSGVPTARAVTTLVWTELAAAIAATLDSVSLSDLSVRGEQLGVRRDADADFSYVI